MCDLAQAVSVQRARTLQNARNGYEMDFDRNATFPVSNFKRLLPELPVGRCLDRWVLFGIENIPIWRRATVPIFAMVCIMLVLYQSVYDMYIIFMSHFSMQTSVDRPLRFK
jgi:hypothetical protein